jgi:hypothetical protein
MGAELMPALMQIDLLQPKSEAAPAFKGDRFHAQNFRIKIDGGVDACHRENKVIQTLYRKSHRHRIIRAARQNQETAPQRGKYQISIATTS